MSDQTTSAAVKPYIDDLAIASIRPNPDNPRKNLGDLAELAASIREQGIIEPLVVEPDTDARNENGWLLVAGHRRLAAAKRAGLDTVPAVVHAEASSRTHRLELMLVENLQRQDLTDVEEGDTYQLLLDLPDAQYTVAALAERIGRPKKYVKDRVKAAGLPEAARERILHGQITLEQSAQIAPFVKDAAEMDRINRAAESGPIALATALEEAKRRRERRQEYQRALRAARAEGQTVYRFDALPDEFAEITELPGLQPTADEIRAAVPSLREVPDNDPRLRNAEYDGLREKHRDFPCHAAYLTETNDLVQICTDPQRHELPQEPAAPAAPAGVDDEKAKAEAERQAQEATERAGAARREREEREAKARRLADLQLRLEARQAVRAQFLHDVLFDEEAVSKIAADELRRSMTRSIENFRSEERAWVGQVLFPSMDRAALADSKTLKKRIERRLEDMSAPALVVLRTIVQNLHDDLVLTKPALNNPTQLLYAEKWLSTLQETFDYEPGDAETELITTEKKRFEG